ncbi:MAG: hypothetical protein JXR23_02055 [Pontiellaceae bacterium]|nr:hypothetical protein [Pontiellaceae bacterium]
MKITPLLFLDIAGILVAIVIAILVKDTSLEMPFGIIASVIGIFIVIRLILLGLVRVADSRLSDVLKFCWVLLILLLPIFGSIGALIVVDKKPY